MQLQDSFGRRFKYLRLSLTELCNFRCNYCLPDGNDCNTPKGGLNHQQISTLIKAFAKLGTTKIRLTGGEPALRKDLCDIISFCKSVDGIQTVALTTNGFLLKRDAYAYKAAGLDAINISADSLDPRMFAAITGKDKLEDILQGAERAQAAGINTIKFNTVMLRQFNFSGLKDFFRFLKEHKVTWRFIELMQTGDNAKFFKANHVSGESLKSLLIEQGWQRIIRPQDAGPAEEYSHPDYAGNIGLIMPYNKDFCASCNRLRVSSLGKLHLCLFSEQGEDISKHLEKGDIDATCRLISDLVKNKHNSHFLHQGVTGATKQLAMLGG